MSASGTTGSSSGTTGSASGTTGSSSGTTGSASGTTGSASSLAPSQEPMFPRGKFIVLPATPSHPCYHGDGSDGRHVCTKYHDHTHYYQATMLEIVINCLRLFFVVTMAMVVMGGMCVQSITAIRTIIRLLC